MGFLKIHTLCRRGRGGVAISHYNRDFYSQGKNIVSLKFYHNVLIKDVFNL